MRTPYSIWQDLGISSPESADIEAIAYFCGAKVKYRTLESCAARIIGKGNKAIITVDENSSISRQRFSIGHELGHWLQDRGNISLACKPADISASRYRDFETDRESAANRFAAELLMPSHIFSEAVRGKQMTFDTVRVCSEVFQTSLTACAIRLIELGSYPSLIVCHHQSGYQWSWRHSDLPTSVRVNKLLSRQTNAYTLLRSKLAKPLGPTEVDADDWAEYPGAENHVVLEDSIRISPNHTLSLIWWQNEKGLPD